MVRRVLSSTVRCVVAVGLLAVTGTTTALPAVAVPAAAAPAVAAPAPPPSAASLANAEAPAAALASTGYTYWGFYSWNAATDSWGYMKVGANDPSTATTSKDGAVYGFRWALVVKDPRLPRAAGDFAAICGSTPKATDKKRIALVVDFGASRDAPNGSTVPAPVGLCAVVDPSATVQQALLSVADVRMGPSGLICGISGYPSTGCGSTDKAATEPPPDSTVTLALPNPTTSSDGGSNTSLLIVVAVVIIILLVGGALVVRRRSA